MADPSNERSSTRPPSFGDAPPSSRRDPLVGRVIAQRFEILGLIARGGMGAVYRAKQLPLGRMCAVKVLSVAFDPDEDPQFQRRFFLEASVAARLTHPSTVRIFDYGQAEDGIYFIAMELIEGKTLFRLLRDENGPLDQDLACHIAKQIARSLREAHELSVVHRDLKPGNILIVDRQGERPGIKVLDFGLVKDMSAELSQVTQAGFRMGSPKYMSPEQVLGEPVSPRTDIYSLGVLLFEMLTGSPPFDKKKAALTATAHTRDPVPSLNSVRPELSLRPGLEAIVMRCLEKKPHRRFSSMQDVLDALKIVSADETGEGARPSYTPPALDAPTVTDGAPAKPPPSTDPVVTAARSALAEAAAPSSKPAPAVPSEKAPTSRVRRLVPSLVVAFAGLSMGLVGAIMIDAPNADSVGAQAVAAPELPALVEAKIVADQTNEPSAPVAAPPPARVHITSDPEGAAVLDGPRRLCEATPCDVLRSDLPTSRIGFEKVGYYPTSLETTSVGDTVSVRLYAVTQAEKPQAAPAGSMFRPSPY